MALDTQTAEAARRPRPAWLRVAFMTLGVGASGAYVLLLWRAWRRVQEGNGLVNFRTAWLAEDNAIGFLVFSAVLGVALVIGVGLRWHQHRRIQREWKELER
jgi:hypothetical protein